MAQVFLSYSREDAARAQQIAEALGGEGLDVFWDNEIPPGSTWADYIETKLTQCNALIVLWSEHSTKSQWVREEARLGRDKGVLIPVMIDTSTPPFGFGELQAANLSSWQGERDLPSWRRFVDAVKNAASSEPRPRAAQSFAAAPPRDHATAPQVQQPLPPPTKKGVPVWVWIVGSVVAILVLLFIIGSLAPKDDTQTQPQQQVADTQPQQPQQPQAQPNQVPPQSAQILTQQLQQVAQAAGQQGFQQVGQVFVGGLIQSQSWNVPAQLNAGVEYRVLGVCDQNCRDMDITVFDESGATVAQDTATDDHPVVSVAPAANGAFTIQAQMFQCTAQPCYYALALYGRMRQ